MVRIASSNVLDEVSTNDCIVSSLRQWRKINGGEERKCYQRFRIGRFCAYNPSYTIVPVLAVLFILRYGSRYYIVTTGPVDLWVVSNSRARLEKAYFNQKFRESRTNFPRPPSMVFV